MERLEPQPAFEINPEAAARLLRKSVDDGCVIYDLETGETQLLSPLSEFIIEILEQQGGAPSRSADLIRRVQDEEPESSTMECTTAVEEALVALVDIGLVQASSIVH